MPQIGGDGVYGGTPYHRTSIAVQTHNSLGIFRGFFK
jgi:hypothetical protein